MILIWKSKYGDVLVYARDADEELRAYKYLFDKMDEQGCYRYLIDDDRADYDAAKRGDMHAARRLLRCRSEWDYEYERIENEPPIIPT